MADLVSQREYARARRVSVQYINKLVKQGKVPLTSGKIDPTAADAAIAATRERPVVSRMALPPATQPSAPGAASAAIQAKAVLDTYKAKREKLRYEREIGEVVAISDVERVLSAHNSSVRSLVLAFPTKVAVKLIGKTAPEIRALLTQELRHLLEQLATPAEVKP